MEQESNPDVKPHVKFLFEEKSDFLSIPVKVETTSLHSETNQDSLCLMTEQKPDIKLFFLQDESVACSVASTRSPDVCAPVSTVSLGLNPHCDNLEWGRQHIIKHLKAEPDSQACNDGTTEEKPFIAELRALVEEYSRNEDEKDKEPERTPARSTEISSLELPKDDDCCILSTTCQETFHCSTTDLTPFRCNASGEEFPSCSQLSDHKQIHLAEKSYKLEDCGKVVCVSSSSSNHKRIRMGEKPYKCDVCGKEFIHRYQVSTHKRIHTGEKPYSCDVCGKGFRVGSGLAMHKRTHTGQKPYKCDDCGKAFIQIFKLFTHMRSHTGEKPYKCDICGERFSIRSNLSRHKGIHTGEKPYSCDVCGKGFRVSSGLSMHKRIHTGPKPYKCDDCGKAFIQICKLFTHVLNHTGEKPYKCDVCGKRFSMSSSLSRHKRIHTGKKPYSCNVCGKGFIVSSHLSSHIRYHTDNKPYKCDICGKEYRCSSAIFYHKKTHTGERPFPCDICGKGFHYRTSLSIHKRIHTGEKPYKCDDCGKEFSQKSSLPTHMRIHTGEKRYKCDDCGKGFRQSGNLFSHMRIHTGEAEEVDQQWEDFKAAVTEAAEKEIPKVTRKAKQRWMTEDILKIMDKRRLAKDNKEEYETLQKVIRKKCDEAKENWINDKCNSIDLHCRSTPQVMYRNIDEITGKKTCSSTGCLKSKNGDIIHVMEKEKILERWEEYISELFEDQRKDHNVMKNNFAGPPIMKDEVQAAIRKMKTGKATGSDGISVELIETLGDYGVDKVTILLNEIYDTEVFSDISSFPGLQDLTTYCKDISSTVENLLEIPRSNKGKQK
ncbi:Zinc finger protein 665 [Plakobranchus ocellatus]|uniref:Zinc finger protein 665 n=1 Tax=Plakobranchus ocellatus TaxID=259542 RepID=A0AAV4CLF6_9GAST|nr:Zinc finger protein 665 [Plakobranchus ocellatus]